MGRWAQSRRRGSSPSGESSALPAPAPSDWELQTDGPTDLLVGPTVTGPFPADGWGFRYQDNGGAFTVVAGNAFLDQVGIGPFVIGHSIGVQIWWESNSVRVSNFSALQTITL